MAKIGVVADDFTGTASSGMMMAKAQVETGLFFDAQSLEEFTQADRLEAVYVSSNSRCLTPEEAKSIVRQTAEALKKNGAIYYSKKIDTTLRGGIGYETDAMLKFLGDEADCGCFPLLALNDGPFFTLVALGVSGLANIPIQSLVAAIIPIALGMLLGNLDEGLKNLFAPMGSAIIPLIGFALGTGINLANVVKGAYAALLSDAYSAERARLSKDANIACMGAFTTGSKERELMTQIFLTNEFVAGCSSQPKVDAFRKYDMEEK